jgi:hypothetical protein
VGDSGFSNGPHYVTVEGTPVYFGSMTAANQFLQTTVPVVVYDGKLSVTIGGGVPNTTINFVTVASAIADIDSDSVANGADNCPLIANPDQLDFENDGLGDPCDADDDNDSSADAADCRPNDGSVFASPIAVTMQSVIGASPTTVKYQVQNVGTGTTYDILSGLVSRVGATAAFPEGRSAAW